MNVNDVQLLQQAGISGASSRSPRTPEEAAKQFEMVLAKQFVQTMTDGMFEANLAGDDSPAWMGAYGDMQQSTLSDVLAQHLVESGSLNVSDLLLRQWSRQPTDAETQTEPSGQAEPSPLAQTDMQREERRI